MATTTSTEPAEVGAAFDLALTESQELVQRTARDFATERLLPIEIGRASCRERV